MKSIEYYVSALRYAANEAYQDQIVDTDMVDNIDREKEEWICDKMQEWLEGGVEQNPVDSMVMRRFRKKGGFEDKTDTVEITADGKCVLNMIDGTTSKPSHLYSLSTCLKFVAKGAWEEVA